MYEEKYLVFVSENNNNKFYHMKRNGNTFTATWGRVGAAGQCKVTLSASGTKNSKRNWQRDIQINRICIVL